MILLWRMDASTTTAEAARNMVIAGIGTGLMMQVFLVAAQNAVSTRVSGATTSLLQFSRAIGTTFGVTIFGVIVNQGLPRAVRGQTVVHRLSGHARTQLANALHSAFLLAACACVVVLVVVFAFIEERPLRRTFDEPSVSEAAGAATGLPTPELPG